jgi:alpha-galactosidase
MVLYLLLDLLTGTDDNCYSDAASGYPAVNYAPSTSPSLHYANMTKALAKLDRQILFQICEWGIDFPALWAPALGNSWRIANDITPAWGSIARILNQAVPQTSFAGPGHWPDLDMLEVGNNIFTVPEEQTHFALWAMLKSPLTIGAALRDATTAIPDASLQILKNEDVIRYNQDPLGISASLKRRWTEEGYEVWAGSLQNRNTIVALINWANQDRTLTIDLPDVDVQYANNLTNIWAGTSSTQVKTSYRAQVAAHGTVLVELEGATPAGTYSSEDFATTSKHVLPSLFSFLFLPPQ